jgi:hypothetical protein
MSFKSRKNQYNDLEIQKENDQNPITDQYDKNIL